MMTLCQYQNFAPAPAKAEAIQTLPITITPVHEQGPVGEKGHPGLPGKEIKKNRGK